MKKNILHTVLLVLIIGCVDEVKLNQDTFQTKLIVEGAVTNAVGPYRVLLSYSLPYTKVGLTQTISGAKVWIVEEGGKTVGLNEVSNGVYETDSAAMRGQVGKAYYVKIRTGNGNEYQSRPERILPPIPIDTFKVGFNPAEKDRNPFQVSVKTKDSAEKGNFYRWKWIHYDTISVCKNAYVGSERKNIKTLCCERCWTVEYCNGCIDIASDALINGKFLEPTIARLPYEATTPYFIILEQYSISKDYYQFWKTISTQINNAGGIFDNAPAQVQGNLYNIADSTEQVLGYFSAAGVTQKPLYIPRDFTNYVPRPISTPVGFDVIYQTDCQTCKGTTRTPRKPTGWID